MLLHNLRSDTLCRFFLKQKKHCGYLAKDYAQTRFDMFKIENDCICETYGTLAAAVEERKKNRTRQDLAIHIGKRLLAIDYCIKKICVSI